MKHTLMMVIHNLLKSLGVDFKGKGPANLFFPFFNAYVGSDIKKSLKNLKAMIESE